MTSASGHLPDKAIECARKHLGLAPGVSAAEVWSVARLDRVGEQYFLVEFRAAGGGVVAAVDGGASRVMSSGRTTGQAPQLTVTLEEAGRLGAGDPRAQISLVWRPCLASMSLLLPFWRVRSGGREVYVDQQRKVWTQLEVPKGGGASDPGAMTSLAARK